MPATNTVFRVARMPLAVQVVCAVLVAVLTVSAAAAAQPAETRRWLVASGDPTVDPRADTGHGWTFIPTATPENGRAAAGLASGFLVHIVPRQQVQRASMGSVRLVLPLTSPPLALASWRGTVMLLQGPFGDSVSGPAERTVSTFSATTPEAPGTWRYRPGDRLQLRVSLPADSVPRSMVGCETPGSAAGPVVVWERVNGAGSGRDSLEIAVLNDAGIWRVLQPPPEFPASAAEGEAHVVGATSGVLVAVRASGEAAFSLWRAAPDVALHAKPGKGAGGGAGGGSGVGASESLQVAVRWERAGIAAVPRAIRSGVVRTIGPSANGWLWRDAGQTLLAARNGESVALWRLDPTRAVELWRMDMPPRLMGALVVAGSDAATFLTYDAMTDAPVRGPSAPEAGRLRLVVVSHLSGLVIADVAAHTDGFFTRAEMAILWALFILIGGVILVVVLQVDGPQELQLPDGTALATPGRRALACALDVALAIGVTSLLVGGSPAQWLAATTSASASLLPLTGVLVAGFLMSTVGEATVGSSPGKLLVGVRVLGLVPASAGAAPKAAVIWTAGRARFHQAFLRNAVRWFMPPIGTLLMVNNNWRHPGDILARTVVVVRFDPSEDGPGVDGDGRPPSAGDDDQ